MAMSDENSYWVKSSTVHILQNFSKKIITIAGVQVLTVKGNNWTDKNIKSTVVKDGQWPFTELELFSN